MNFLNGANGGSPQDPRYILELYLQLGDIKKPIKLAIAIAEADMQKQPPNYAAAHRLLFETYKRLIDNGQRSTLKLHTKLLHVHTKCRVIKNMVKNLKEIEIGARLSERVAQNLSHIFGKSLQKGKGTRAHQEAAKILTSTVIQNYKAGLKQTAFKTACQLLSPEYRNFLVNHHKKYVKLVKQIARRPVG